MQAEIQAQWHRDSLVSHMADADDACLKMLLSMDESVPTTVLGKNRACCDLRKGFKPQLPLVGVSSKGPQQTFQMRPNAGCSILKPCPKSAVVPIAHG